MKGTIVIVLLICFCTSYITSQAQWVQVFPTSYRYVNIDFFDQDNGFLVSLEEVLKSTDGGDTWYPVIIPGAQVHYSDIVSDEPIEDVIFFNELGEKLFESTNINNKEFHINLSDYKPRWY